MSARQTPPRTRRRPTSNASSARSPTGKGGTISPLRRRAAARLPGRSLSAAESGDLEALLARSAAGRRRLLELAGVDRNLPLRRVRNAVLGRPARRGWTTPSWAPAAAIAAAAAAILVAVLSPFFLHVAKGPGSPAYDVAARGLAEVRAAEPAPGPAAEAARAYAGTTLRILVRAREDGTAGASFALYRRGAGGGRKGAVAGRGPGGGGAGERDVRGGSRPGAGHPVPAPTPSTSSSRPPAPPACRRRGWRPRGGRMPAKLCSLPVVSSIH